MGKLRDIFNKKNRNNNDIGMDNNPVDEIIIYNKSWLMRISNATGFIISDNRNKVDGILKALNRRNGHCPCGGNGDQFICPCVVMRDKGICKCGLFENVIPLNPRGNSTGSIKGHNE